MQVFAEVSAYNIHTIFRWYSLSLCMQMCVYKRSSPQRKTRIILFRLSKRYSLETSDCIIQEDNRDEITPPPHPTCLPCLFSRKGRKFLLYRITRNEAKVYANGAKEYRDGFSSVRSKRIKSQGNIAKHRKSMLR